MMQNKFLFILDKHWSKTYWPARTELTVQENNVICQPLVPQERVIFPPLYTKLSLIKQFAKAIDKKGQFFLYICQVFPDLSIEKPKAGVFDSPDIRRLIKDENFTSHMTTLELNAWNLFLGIVELVQRHI